MSRRALVTGVAGQDGSLLADLLLGQGYDVVGVVRGGVAREPEHLSDRVELVQADLLDAGAVPELVARHRPDEIYNLASPSFSPASWDDPVATVQVVAGTTAAFLEAIRRVDPAIRFFQASSSEIFGAPSESPQTEQTPVRPVTPYGAAKACAHFLVQGYRQRHGLFACSGILYNHESERRSQLFLPRKVASGAAAIALGLEDELRLGDLQARRDWGSAYDVVRAMWLTLLHPEPDDYVIATGESHSVAELVECAFRRVDLDWTRFVRVDEALKRATDERHDLVGDPSKARTVLGWSPLVAFEDVVHGLVDAEMRRLTQTSPRRATHRTHDGVTGTAPLRLPGGRVVEIDGDERDRSILGQLRSSGGEWESHVSAVLQRLVRPDWVCVDAGANIGVHTLPLAALGRAVVAFEASPHSCAHLRANVEAAGLAGRTTIVEAALWDRPRELELVATPRFAGAAYVAVNARADGVEGHPQVGGDGVAYPTEIRKVAALRLDDWISEHRLDRLDLVKIDVEGAERIALSGATAALHRFRPFLVTEYNPQCATALFGEAADAYFSWLREIFSTTAVIEEDGGLSPVETWSDLEGRLLGGPGWLDLLCAPSGRDLSSAAT